MSSEAGSAVLAAVFAYPKDVDERRTRIYYGGVFILAKSVALSLALIPPSDEVQKLLFGLSIVNLVLSFVLDACARRETKKWAGETGQETQFFHCLLETVIGSWATHKVLDTSKRAYTRLTGKGEIHLPDEAGSAATSEQQASDQPSIPFIGDTENITLEDWIQDISWAYSAAITSKKVLATAVVVLRYLYDKFTQRRELDIAARVISSFVSLVLVDLIDGLSKEESRLRSRTVQKGFFDKLGSWWRGS